IISMFFLIASFTINTLSPKLAGKFQVATTLVKLVPLLLMGVVGCIAGLRSGMTVQNFSTVVREVPKGSALLTAVCAAAFAYEGWIIATSINAELKNSKKNLPIALICGTFIVMLVYILYYIGLAGAVTNETLMAG
ncbi:MAG: amino acid permease, partial [Clostridia bacterium]